MKCSSVLQWVEVMIMMTHLLSSHKADYSFIAVRVCVCVCESCLLCVVWCSVLPAFV